jgi:CheY-like chemotaxis protein/nitrogen-specific signal transduction histidine kinase
LSDITERKLAEAQRVKFEANNQHIQKVESLERMATAIAHLFNNQFHVVLGNLELALEGLATDADPRKNVIKAIQAIHRSSEVSGQLLAYLGQNNVKQEPLDLSGICRLNMPGIESVTPDYITLQTDLVSPGPVVYANANQIKQVLASLITNGWEAMRGRAGGGEVKVVTKTLLVSDIPRAHVFPTGWAPVAETFACLEVTDTGCGMTEDEVGKIFDPFYSTKAIGRGLGLAVVIGIIKAWGGMISVKTSVGVGSSFGVFVPHVVDMAPRRIEKLITQGDFETGGAVLLVDDDSIVRDIAETLLKHIGFTVFSAAGGDEAIALFQKHRDNIKCLLTDLSMPAMDGWETLAALRKIQPHLPAILSSGYDENQAMSGDHAEFPQAFLHKPYTMANLKEVLCRVLGDATKKIN